jgi:iron complex transport system substrate-binding protein
MLDNPELRLAFPGPHRLDIPARLWLCGLPQTLDALAALREARLRLEATQP